MSDQRFRITVRGDKVELRGHIVGYENVQELAASIEELDLMVVASVAEVQSPSPLPQKGDPS